MSKFIGRQSELNALKGLIDKNQPAWSSSGGDLLDDLATHCQHGRTLILLDEIETVARATNALKIG